MSYKIISIVGARPQFVKSAMVSGALDKLHNESLQHVMVHTGQHYDAHMSDIFFEQLGLKKPHFFLGIGSHSQGKQTGLMLESIEAVLMSQRPDMVILYGDTNSTLAGALAASKLHIPIVHVEAGMRSFNSLMAEEINRKITDHLSSILFCSSAISVTHLLKEGIQHSNTAFPAVYEVGDVMLDALKIFEEKADRLSQSSSFQFKPKDYFLVTIHRAENVDDFKKLKTIIETLDEIAADGYKLIFPVHPRTEKAMRTWNLNPSSQHFNFIKPVSYLEMVWLEKNACAVVTDSGGVQKEACFFNVPVLTLRDETEWVETLEVGLNRLVPIEREKILEAFLERTRFHGVGSPFLAYGRGDSSQKIASHLQDHLSLL
ncbi:MAG: UDP-N-acetylglucosamine 2-epimerase (non-hydrolyzing) [Deltaproteobacteria bacterium]|nr:UDP-N-acetylglucosamine 2-epimerase (non-hydrolyzing) [Deltaproteobacteria bacterium]